MATTKAERNESISVLEDVFSDATGIYLTDFTGIDVGKITELRRNLRDGGSKYIVVKNKLAQIALERTGKGQLNEYLKGPVGVAVTSDDATSPARVIKSFNKDYKDALGLKVAYVDGTVFQAEEAGRLSDLPSREVLLSQFLSCLNAPVTNFAGVLNGILLKFVGTLEAVRTKKEESGE